MLADPRADAVVNNFVGQWLFLRNLPTVLPDPRKDPDFDEDLRQGFRRETELFAGSILRDDRSVLELLTANYTFVNERLAQHYGIPNIRGTHFRRVELTDVNRRGLLGHGSVLAVTSYPESHVAGRAAASGFWRTSSARRCRRRRRICRRWRRSRNRPRKSWSRCGSVSPSIAPTRRARAATR